MKYILSVCILAAAFLVNPLWGCGGDTEPEFTYDRQDMVDYATGTWSGSLKLASSDATEFTLIITERTLETQEQRLEYREVKQPACSRVFSRNLGDYFVRSAYACIQMSTLPIDAQLSTGDGHFQDEKLAGEVIVMSLNLNGAWIEVALPNGGTLHAKCDADFKCAEGFFYTVEDNQRADGEFIAMQKD